MAIEVGTQVKLLPTSDEDIDKYIGQIGTVASYDFDWTGPQWDKDRRPIVHYFVQMADGVEVVISDGEFEVVKEQV